MTRYVMGEGGGGGKGGSGGGSARAAVEDPDSLQSHQYAKVVDLISEGEIGGLVDGLRSVFLNDTPIVSQTGTVNFTGVELDYRNGTNNQSYLPGFSDVENETQVNVQIKNGIPIVRSISGDVDAARVTLGFPVLTNQNTKTGDLHGTSVDVSIEVNNNGGGFKPVPLRYQWSAVSGAGTQIDVANSYGVGMTAVMVFAAQMVQTRYNKRYSTSARKLQPLSWKVEYKAPGGSWTLLVTDSAPPQSTYSSANISRSYNSPSGAFGTWSMRITLLSAGSVASISGSQLILVNTDTISGKTTTRYRRSYYIPLPAPGPWDIRVNRLTADSSTSSLRNETWWDSLAEIVESRLSYPNSAVVGLKIDAEQFSDIPSRGYEIYGIKCKVPSNYDPIAKTYSGTWNGTFKTAWTDNPAWVYYDLATVERYGLGRYIDASKIDKWALYEIGKYCDEDVPSGYGSTEPRFTCNAYIQTREDAYKLMMNLASVFRGMAYWSSAQIVAVADMPREATALFTNANVIDGTFTYSGSSRGTRHTVALVTWNDPDDMYRQKVEYVDDEEGIAKYGINQTEVVAFACTSRGQARRMGKWILYTERMESEIVSWKTGLEGFGVYPGAIIKVADSLRSGDRIGGRVLNVSGDTVHLDAPVTILNNVAYTLSLVTPSGDVVDFDVANGAGTWDQLQVFPTPSEVPQDYSMWILASDNLNPQTMRILSVTEASETQVEITALHHDPHKFEMIEYDHKFEPPKTSSIPNGAPSAPTNPVATDTLYLQGPGVVGTKCHVSWEGSAKRYEIRWKQFNNNFAMQSETSTSTDIMPVETGEITIQIRSVDTLGRRSTWATLTYNVLGKAKPPAAPLNFTGTVTDAGIVLVWAANTELDMKEYEIFVNGVSVQKTSAVTWTYPNTPSGTTNFVIKAIDTTGNSSDPTSTSVTIVAPAAPSVSYAFSAENVVLTVTKPSSQLSIDYYEVFYTDPGGQLVSLGKTYATTFPVRGAWVGSRTLSVKATDIGGNTSAAGTVAVSIVAPPKPELTAQVIDNNVLLFWTSGVGSLPIDTFEVRRGNVWATAELIGKKSGGFTTVFETAGGEFNYLVAAIDTAGNYSVAASRSAAVSQPPDYILKVNTDSIFAVDEPNGVIDAQFSNAILDADGAVLLPVNLTETYQQHFTTHGWASPQDQVNANYPIFAQPGALNGYYEEVIDLGNILAAMKITLSYVGEAVAGSPIVTTMISTKKIADDPWLDNVGVTQFYGTNFQYIKVRIAVSGADGVLYKITGINTRLDAKLISDASSTVCLSTDASGTVVNFNVPFIDVTSITVSPQGTTPISFAYDFHDANEDLNYSVSNGVATVLHTGHPYVVGQNINFLPMTGGAPAGVYQITSIQADRYTFAVSTANTTGTTSIYPGSMRIYLFNSTTGSRVSGTASWSIKGY